MVVGACNPSHWEGWGRRTAWTQEAEVAVSWDCTTALCFERESPSQNKQNMPGAVAHACNPSTLRGRGGLITWGQEFQDQPGQHGKTLSLLTIQKLARHGGRPLSSQIFWRLRQGKSLEPGRWRLQWVKIMPLHSSLGNKSETSFQKNKKSVL